MWSQALARAGSFGGTNVGQSPRLHLSTKRELLHSHIRDLTDEQVVLAAAVDRVDRAELFRQLSGFAELSDDGSIQLHLVDLAAYVEIFRRIGIRAVEELVRSWCDAKRGRSPDVGELCLERAVVIEDLD